ncbi:MAG TPA: 2-hydroxychromene-2-carboxylate isomerase [Burkholderiales bacterium]|nr:2-hydroxychromene-2-carboxylate isomerase [Burkholderiales bacterium]
MHRPWTRDGKFDLKKADWYFDFISPYSYIGFKLLDRFDGRLDIRCRPVLFAALLDHWENKGPAEIPPKRNWTFRWCTWWAGHLGIPFRMPAAHPFNPLPYLRLSIAAGNTREAISRIFDAVWTTGNDAADEQGFLALAKSLDIDPARLADQSVKDALRAETDKAISFGIFGVPTLLVDQELFWGADAMEFVEAYLADPGIVATGEMQRAAMLPVGVTRRRN